MERTKAKLMRLLIALILLVVGVESGFANDKCVQFTGAVQTWDENGLLTTSGTARIFGSVAENRVGFPSVSTPYEYTNCDTGMCVADPSLMVPRYDFPAYSYGVVDFDPNGEATITPDIAYRNITLNGEDKVTFEPGHYFADTVSIGASATALMNGQVYLHANKINIYGASEVNIVGEANALYLVGHGSDALISLSSSRVSGDSPLTAFVISENQVQLSGDTVLTGAVAALELKMIGSSKIRGDISSCDDATLKLDVDPISANALVNSSIPLTFSILDSQVVDLDAQGTFNLSHDGPEQVCLKTSDGGNCLTDTSALPFSSGSATYYLFSSVETEVNLSLFWNETPAVTGSGGGYHFQDKSFVFEPSPVQMIAGKPIEVTIKAMHQGSVMSDYTGPKTLELTSTLKVKPSSGSMNASLQNGSVIFNAGVGKVTIEYFDAGLVSLEIREVASSMHGDMLVGSRPHSFAICNITSSGLNAGYDGTATAGVGFAKAGEAFQARLKPVIWLDEAVTTDSSGDGLADAITSSECARATTPNYYGVMEQPAGVKLSHRLHTPASGQAGSLNQVNGDNGWYWFESTAQAKYGKLLTGLSWNEVGSLWLQADNQDYALGALDQGVASIGRFYPHHFALNSHVVSEGQGQFTYMGQGYGALFKVAAMSQTQLAGGTVKTVTKNYTEFSNDYLMAIELKGLDASKSAPTPNDLTARINDSSIASSGWESDWSEEGTLGIDLSILKFKKVETQSAPLVTKTVPDGPYRVQMGLEVNSGNLDCATKGCSYFDTTDAYRHDGTSSHNVRKIGEELDVRYGRLKMFDVGGNSNSVLSVPLLAEYWDGAGFVENTLDSGSAYNGDHFCRLRIWPTAGASLATLSGLGVVSSGAAQLSVQQNQISDEVREQVKMWLRIGKAPTGFENGLNCFGSDGGGLEYLHYNWDGRGDESPRAIITFGVYRGNDRVLFRGEPRMY